MIMRIDVRVARDYICADCGKTQQGSTRHEEFNSIESAVAWLNGAPSPNYMPVGWQSFGRRVYLCPEHRRP